MSLTPTLPSGNLSEQLTGRSNEMRTGLCEDECHQRSLLLLHFARQPPNVNPTFCTQTVLSVCSLMKLY